MTKEELKQCYDEMKEVDFSEDYSFFEEHYSVSALSKLEGKDLAIRLFATAPYGDRIGVRGYFIWAEKGTATRDPLGKASIFQTANIQYDGNKFYITEKNKPIDIQEEEAIKCAKNIRVVFNELVNIAQRYINGNRLDEIAGYRELNREILEKIRQPNFVENINKPCFLRGSSLTPFIIKYFHCCWKNFFAFWYSSNRITEIFKNILFESVDGNDDAIVLNGQLSLFAKKIDIDDSDKFGVLLNHLRRSLTQGSVELSGEADERQQLFKKYLYYFLDYYNNWGEAKKYYGKLTETARFKTIGNQLADIKKSRSTIDGYCGKLIRTWTKYCKNKYSSPYDIFDSNLFEPMMKYSQSDLDADVRNGYIWYNQFLKALEMGLRDSDLTKFNEQAENQKGEKHMTDHELNLILYGPPGTGKTYHSIIRAVEIIDGNNENADLKVKTALQALQCDPKDRKAYQMILDRYRTLLQAGRIAFTTFHQSYGYEEFIEGIKPDFEADEIKYKRTDGVFKAFCDKARKINGQELIKANATVWKVSLGRAGDNDIRSECMKNNHIRIGWDEYGEAVSEDTDYSSNGGKRILNAFINDMDIGDIVLSCYSTTEIDAIGIIEGEYEWCDEYSSHKRVRKVKWLIKGIKEDIKQINNEKRMMQPAVYRLDIATDELIKLTNKHQKAGVKLEYNYDEKYVFIIDEINRGNVSKIFGELITLIESSKRLGADEEMTCTLPYSGVKFGVPRNVYILGTMNTADRSLVQLDAALRRRFDFEEMMPNPNLLGVTKDKIDLNKLLTAINKRITALLDREHQIGHSYFMKLNEQSTVLDVHRIFKKNVLPLLQEYFFDDYESIQKVLGEQFVEKQPNLFDNGKTMYEIKCPDTIGAYQEIYGGVDTALAQTDE